MKVAVIGGGMNGIMTAWQMARRGCDVDLFEKDRLMSAASRASTKMLHGGLRYPEHGHFGLVREALRERSWWLKHAPELLKPLEILLPVHAGQGVSLAGCSRSQALWTAGDLQPLLWRLLERSRHH